MWKFYFLNSNINDNLRQLLETYYDHYFGKLSLSEQKELFQIIKVSSLLEVKTGKEDANFSNPLGKYNFFTCSKDTLKCDTPAFLGHAILIAGNGDFNVKHYTGNFNAYQRTYVLIPENELYYGSIYMSAVKLIQKFKKASSGSIVKFISKGDVENIQVVIPKDKSLLLQLNDYLFSIERNLKENEELISIRDTLLPLLINGQAIIN